MTFRFTPKRQDVLSLYDHLLARKGKEGTGGANAEAIGLMLDGLKYRKLMAASGHPEVNT